ncbi:MAG: DUF4294 domain-containing protein [Paludibacteraceae bacterium]|nr:DUF4294 domain-containing protein [Paludibacteraceae bacterium]MBO7635391.1 DUF4294 domain-containing protein [Paludibacteraceae bacterium]MBR5972716.1 DUF4294 domain-containing protein [Paludibacteraceae bacterium]
MKLMKFIKYIIPLFFVQAAYSIDDVEVGKRVPAYIDESGDTIPNIWLQPVYVFPKLVFKNEKQEKFYWRTVRDVKKTLPYAKIIAGLVNECDSVMATLKTEKERKEYMKQKEDELVAIYKPIFRKMTLSQGKMMIRLVDRQCAKTSYTLVKQFRGGFRAAFWQGFAKMLGADLKVSYDPNDENDRIVERVIILVEAGQL